MIDSPHWGSRSDQELVDATKRGESLAFEALYYRYRDWVARLAYRYTADRDDALDVLQETFVYLLRRCPNLRLSARMTTFLYPVVKHLALEVRRKRRRIQSDRNSTADLAAPSPLPQSASRSELAEVMAALPDEQREAVLMRFVDGLTLAEIAQALAVPLGTVKSRLHRALDSLKADPRTRRYFGI